MVFGAGNEPGTVEVDGGLFSVASEQVVRLTVDTRAGQVEVLPLESLAVKGSVAQDGVALGYAGNGIWSSNVELTRAGGNEYIGRYIYFAFNGMMHWLSNALRKPTRLLCCRRAMRGRISA